MYANYNVVFPSAISLIISALVEILFLPCVHFLTSVDSTFSKKINNGFLSSPLSALIHFWADQCLGYSSLME